MSDKFIFLFPKKHITMRTICSQNEIIVFDNDKVRQSVSLDKAKATKLS